MSHPQWRSRPTCPEPATDCALRNRLTPVILAVTLAGLFTACAERRVEATFRDHLASVLAGAGPATIDLAAAMRVPWDTVAIINPYSSQAEVDAALGFHWRASRIAAVMRDDLANALVFVRAGRVEATIVVDRRHGDFCCEVRNGRYARTDAVFEVVRDRHGTRLRHVSAGAG